MTNRELLNMPRTQLGPVDRQRLLLLRMEVTSMPCLACGAAPGWLAAEVAGTHPLRGTLPQ